VVGNSWKKIKISWKTPGFFFKKIVATLTSILAWLKSYEPLKTPEFMPSPMPKRVKFAMSPFLSIFNP
jgi:hypothetical protein